MNQHKVRLRFSIAAVSLALLIGCKPTDVPAEPKPKAPSIRVVTQGFAKMPEYPESLKIFLVACQIEKELPLDDSLVPAASVLATVPIHEVEQLFDGPLSATYDTETRVRPDGNDGCKFKLFRTYSVKVQKSCSYEIIGSVDQSISELSDVVNRPTATTSIHEEKRSPLPPGLPANAYCKDVEPGPPTSTAGLPLEPNAKGPACVWYRHIMRRELLANGTEIPPDNSASMTDHCVHPIWSTYPYHDANGDRQSVVLKTNSEMMLKTEVLVPEQHSLIRNTALYEEGKPIPASRFTRAGIEAHIKQPTWLPLGDKK